MIDGELISGNAFASLGVTAELGRTLSLADDLAPGSGPVVVLSHGFWRSDSRALPWFSGRSFP